MIAHRMRGGSFRSSSGLPGETSPPSISSFIDGLSAHPSVHAHPFLPSTPPPMVQGLERHPSAPKAFASSMFLEHDSPPIEALTVDLADEVESESSFFSRYPPVSQLTESPSSSRISRRMSRQRPSFTTSPFGSRSSSISSSSSFSDDISNMDLDDLLATHCDALGLDCSAETLKADDKLAKRSGSEGLNPFLDFAFSPCVESESEYGFSTLVNQDASPGAMTRLVADYLADLA